MKFNYLMTAALALTLGLASCSSDEKNPGGSSIPEGERTYMSLQFSSPKTYAPHPGTALESKINTVDVLVYDAAGNLKTHKSLNNFTEAAGVWSSTSLIETTSGVKDIYVGVNLPATIITSLSTTNKTVAAVTNVPQLVSVADIATDNNFVMFSDKANATLAVWDGTGAAPGANKIQLSVKRLAAKVTMQVKAGLVLTGVDKGTISDLKFALGQLNQSTFAGQNLVGGKIQDPNYTAPTVPGTGLTGAPIAADFITVSAATIAIDALAAKYAPENTNDNTISGNLTYIAVRGEYYPDAYQEINGGGNLAEVTPNATAAGTTFYCIKAATGNVYFYDMAAANKYVTDNSLLPAAILTYTDALCYYTTYINFNNDYDVYRNDFYQSHIKSILGLGDTAPGPIDPTNPVDVKTNIQVEITVLPWELIEEDHDLTPQ